MIITSHAAASPWDPPIKLGETSDAWTADNETLEIVTDEITRTAAFQGRKVLRGAPTGEFVTNEKIDAGTVIKADFRLPVDTTTLQRGFWRGFAMIQLLQSDDVQEAKDSAYSVRIDRARYKDPYSYAVTASHGDESTRRLMVPIHTEDSVSPLMNEHERVVLERRAGELPLAKDRIYRARVELRQGSLRVYVNGRFIEEYEGDIKPGKVRIVIRDEVRLVNASVQPLEQYADKFIPVSLNDLINEKGPGDVPALAGEPGDVLMVNDVPFVVPGNLQGQDHLDLEPSIYLYRMGLHRQGDSRRAVNAPEGMDVTRFTFRVPERTYRRAWVIAASDGHDRCAPIFTIRFYRPRMSWTSDQTAEVPLFTQTTGPEDAKRIEVKTAKGEPQSLWMIPIELDAARFAAEPMVSVELTKGIYDYRGWPDPAYYNTYPGGLPSAVRVYGLTLEEAPVWAHGTGTKNGNLYPDAQQPVWRVPLKNLTDQPQDVTVKIDVTDPYGKTQSHTKKVTLKPGDEQAEVVFEPKRDVFGLHEVLTTVSAGDFTQSRRRLPVHARVGPEGEPL